MSKEKRSWATGMRVKREWERREVDEMVEENESGRMLVRSSRGVREKREEVQGWRKIEGGGEMERIERGGRVWKESVDVGWTLRVCEVNR